MKRERITRWLAWFAVIVWSGVIFAFSAQNGETSGSLSGGITETLTQIFTPHWEELSPETQQARLDIWHFLVRKAAHVTEFAILGGLWLNVWTRQLRRVDWRPAALSAGCGLLWAATDELHQLFVPERGPSVRDVCIDFSGVLLGIAVTALIFHIVKQCTEPTRKIRQNRENVY